MEVHLGFLSPRRAESRCRPQSVHNDELLQFTVVVAAAEDHYGGARCSVLPHYIVMPLGARIDRVPMQIATGMIVI